MAHSNFKIAQGGNRSWTPTIKALPIKAFKDPRMAQNVSAFAWCIRHNGKFLSRRSFANACANVWRDFDGSALNENSQPYELGDIDELLGAESDLDFDWLRGFFSFALEEPSYSPSDKICRRLQFIELTLRIGGPKLWRDLYA